MFSLSGKAPWLEIETATFADQWMKTLENPQHSDVTFIVEDRNLSVHKIMLCSASKFFARVFGVTESSEVNLIFKLSMSNS